MEARHDTVFLQEAVEALAIEHSDTVVDATVGGAGHFTQILHKLDNTGTLVGIDADSDALSRTRDVAEKASPRVELVENNFRNLSQILDELHIEKIDKSLFDLGWSGFQLTANRGFSFQKDEPLLMTYNKDDTRTVAQLVNSATEEEISDILHALGEERFARPIARSIVRERHQKRILTTFDLVQAVVKGTPVWYQNRKVHPATKTFQAFRIAVNDELDAVRDGLSAALKRTSPEGRIAVITFHSIEDRIVKMIFRNAVHEGLGTILTKKPIVPSSEEVSANRRARSAKLRVFARGSLHIETPVINSYQKTYA